MLFQSNFKQFAYRITSLIMLIAIVLALVVTPERAAAAGEKYLVKYADGAKASVVNEVLSLGGEVRFEFDRIQTLAITLDAGKLSSLKAAAGVVSVEPDAVYRLLGQSTPYGIDMVQARDTWDANRDGVVDSGAPTGKGITVCIVDTGIYAPHEDLGGGGVAILAGRSWVGEDWDRDGHGHGTHVAGTVAAKNNSTGVVGVSPGDVELLIADVFNDAGDGQDSSVILDAAYWCADNGADIISMSLGGPVDTLEDGYADIYNQGVLVIAAAGNDGGPVNSYPASFPSVVSVAAIDNTGTVADFSNFVPEVEVAAPGVSVLSAWPFIDNVVVQGGPTFSANPVEFANPQGTTTAPLADGGDCNTAPPPNAYQGKIVLCQRATLPFTVKIDNAASGGAVGVILWNNVDGNFSGTYNVCCAPVPAVSITMVDGQNLKDNWLGATVSMNIHHQGIAGYSELSGTSMATPHASGIASVIWSACPALTNDQVRSHLSTFTIETEADSLAGRDIFYGYGLPQLKNAVDGLRDGVDGYDANTGNADGNNPANVECPEAPVLSASALGAGWLKTGNNKKINFGFDVSQNPVDGAQGGLQMQDKSTGAKVDVSNIQELRDGANCAGLVAGSNVVEILGEGTYNGQPGSFRACASDNADPGKGVDGFYLECVAGCSYNTLASGGDTVIDNGNIDVTIEQNETSSGASQPQTMQLDPLLLSEGLAGQVQLLTVKVYDQYQQPAANVQVTLQAVAANGSTQTLRGLSDLTGLVVFSVVNLSQTVEYTAVSGAAESNAVEVKPVLK